MGGLRILSDAQIDTMAELREKGWSARRIADWFTARGTKISAGSIYWQCLRIGADVPQHRRQTMKRRLANNPAGYVRGKHMVRPFTKDEDQKLLELERSGASVGDMAVALARKENSVRGRLYTLAAHERRAEEAAQ